MQGFDKTLDDVRDRCGTPRLSRWLAFGLAVVIAAVTFVLVRDRWETPAAQKARLKAEQKAQRAATVR